MHNYDRITPFPFQNNNYIAVIKMHIINRHIWWSHFDTISQLIRPKDKRIESWDPSYLIYLKRTLSLCVGVGCQLVSPPLRIKLLSSETVGLSVWFIVEQFLGISDGSLRQLPFAQLTKTTSRRVLIDRWGNWKIGERHHKCIQMDSFAGINRTKLIVKRCDRGYTTCNKSSIRYLCDFMQISLRRYCIDLLKPELTIEDKSSPLDVRTLYNRQGGSEPK